MSQALYRKYRSKSLSDIVGQSHITDILSRALKADRIAHAYLLTGPPGVGKTSIARILAHEINQLPYTDDSNHLDIIEIDAASNNGVEDVRDLREKVQLAPVSAKKKVYIIDEVHMLSKPAFNALLKTLEEPPEHIVFILATTDVEKLPATIISRTQRFGFRAISTEDAIKHLKHIAIEEKIAVSDDALRLIAEHGQGSFRNSISLLDQLASISDAEITPDLIEQSLGLAPAQVVSNLLTAVASHNITGIATILSKVEADGISPVVLTNQLIHKVREQAPEHPQLLPLLDALLDVAKSSQPSMKLLSVLGTAALEHKPKTAALATPVREVSATIAELEKQATKMTPQSTNEAPKEVKPTALKQAQPKPALKGAQLNDFDWDTLVEHARKNFVALYSVLSKCSHEVDDETLTLYTGNAFYKKKLDDPKYNVHLYKSLEAIGGYSPTIHTIPTPPPMKNSQAAAIADIMGGGIEVSPEAV